MLVTRRQRNDHRRTPSHTRLADDGKVVPILELLWIECTSSRFGRLPQPRYQGAADALSMPINAHDFLCRAVELEQTLADLAILDAVPDVMGRKTTVTLVNKSTVKALRLLGLAQTGQPVLGFISVGWNNKPATKQKRK